jgi:hypothetical protein
MQVIVDAIKQIVFFVPREIGRERIQEIDALQSPFEDIVAQ